MSNSIITIITSALLFVSCQSTTTSINTTTSVSSSAAKPLNDRKIRIDFSKQLGDMKDSKKTTDIKSLLSQLKEEKKCSIEIQEAKTQSLSTADLFEQCVPSTLIVGNIYNCGKCNKWHNSMASGYAVASDVIATNYHVLDNTKASAMGIMTPNGDVYPIIEVLASNKADDVALARIKVPQGKPALTPASIASHTPIGSRIGVISHPTGRFYTFTEGMISRYFSTQFSKDKEAVRMAITADYAKGSSGGPVFDEAGNICGMVSSTNSIYYNRDKKGIDQNLQMVIKNCIPAASVLKLIENIETK
ncbi:MAG: serine protease [Lentisphaeraceae bacterium]|nr:serine protease [Lentisphaeraceae bacterium]